MKTKVLNNLFIALIVIMVILLIILVLVNIFEKEESKAGNLPDITGAMHSFEVSHGESNFCHPTKEVSERYDEKYFEYLEHMQEQRDKTFMKGKVFLREK
jgi:hypothetical protein